MSYWAHKDPLFTDGHYVEQWELRRVAAMSEPVRVLIARECAAGNKLKGISRLLVEFERPPTCGVLDLPEGLAFFTPIYHSGTRVYDGDEDGLIMNPSTGEVVVPTGHEGPDPRQPCTDGEGSDHAL